MRQKSFAFFSLDNPLVNVFIAIIKLHLQNVYVRGMSLLDISQAMEVLCKNISSVNGSQKICITTISRFALTNVMLFCLGGGQMLGSGVTRHPN